MSSRAVPPLHGLEAVFVPHLDLPARGCLALYRPDGSEPEPGEHGRLEPVRVALAPGDGPPRLTEVVAVTLGLDRALDELDDLLTRSGSVGLWARVLRAGLELAAAERMVPTLRGGAAAGVRGVWEFAADDSAVTDVVARLVAALPPAAHALARGDDRVWSPEALVRAGLDAVADHAVRAAGEAPRAGRPRARLLPWTRRWAEALADPADADVPLREDPDEVVAAVAAWTGHKSAPAPAGSLELVLQAPGVENARWPLGLGVRTDDGRFHDAAGVWAATGGEPTGLQQVFVRDLATAARRARVLEPLLHESAPTGIELDLDDAWSFLSEGVDALTAEGIVVRLPPGLAVSDLALRLRVGVDPGETAAESGAASVSGGEHASPLPADEDDEDEREPTEAELAALEGGGWRGGDSGTRTGGLLTGFRWEVALGGETLSPEDFHALVAAQAPLVRLRDRWVRVDPARLARLRGLGDGGEMALAEALALGLAGTAADSADLVPGGVDSPEEVEVVASGGVAALVERLRAAGERPAVEQSPAGFHGTLRSYQARGVAWLQGMRELGFGAVLADDMGTGKTIAAIVHFLLTGGTGPHLVVCPTSVLGNWQREIARFAPGLEVTRHHGPERASTLADVRGVLVTTYGTLRRDVDLLAGVDWELVCLDEAQQVKNPSTAGARAARRLRAGQRVALTGTPLENRLVELWSLLDATNPGLLGSRARFARRFATPIEQHADADAARRLRRLVAPFVLRRAKTDPEVAADLPDKIERTVVAPLTPEQAALYQAAVDRVLGDGLGGATAMERRGRVLALLTELKQICNHPAQYLREREHGTPTLAGRSGKLATAREILREATDGGAQAIVFTQYVEMGHLLVAQLARDLDTDVPFLHGGTPARQRDRIVATFNGELAVEGGEDPPPVLVVSLRAGGTGLNLTAASHVVHYDRWWNPAVEDQATDRAHRIGSTSAVEVHKLVTAGTVEERVAEVLEAKRDLAERVVGTGEAWVTELGDAELADLVALGRDAVTELDDDEAA